MPRNAAAIILATGVLFAGASEVFAQPQPSKPAPLPPGNRIHAQHGDTIVLENDAQVKILRRREANVRTIFSPAERWVVLLADYATNAGPDGRPDWSYTYREVSGDWPMEERWEGQTTIEEYSIGAFGAPGARGLGFTGPRGLVQLLSMGGNDFRDPAAVAVLSFRGAGAGMLGVRSFDEAEVEQIANTRRNVSGTSVRSFSSGGRATASLEAVTNLPPPRQPQGDGTQPIRVGGNIRQPEKLVDAAPVLPEAAALAGIRGVVILELTIGPDGTVRDARVLRSIPLLDGAALDAVRQWRFTPTLLNGRAVPVIVTAAVPFQ